jgi:hypothetical protein
VRWLDALVDNMYDALPSRNFGPFSLWGSLFNVVVSSILVIAFVWISVTQAFEWLLVLGGVGGVGLVAIFLRIHIRSRRGDFLPQS